MNRRNAISRMLGAPLALAIGPVVMAGENMAPVRPRRQKPYIDSNPDEPDYDCCPCKCICLDTGSPTFTVTISGVTR